MDGNSEQPARKTRTPRRRLRRWLGLLGLLILAGGGVLTTIQCVSCMQFDSDWDDPPESIQQNLQAAGQQGQRDLLVGRWEGAWESTVERPMADGGNLKAIITKTDENTYHAQFKATYWKVMTYTAPVDLTVVKGPEKWTFTGQADLGIYGDFTYDGWSDGTTLFCNYSAETDTGKYELKRLAEAPAAEDSAAEDSASGAEAPDNL
ncbi:MAG: hypothetical protein ACLFUJ_01775 [Phycisphaerae bacterium]